MTKRIYTTWLAVTGLLVVGYPVMSQGVQVVACLGLAAASVAAPTVCPSRRSPDPGSRSWRPHTRGPECSAGVALWDGREAADELVIRADRALYEAKIAGRDRAISAEPSTAAGLRLP